MPKYTETRAAEWLEYTLGALKYLLAALTIFGGVVSMLTPLTPIAGPLGFLYGTRVGLVLFGLVVACCGLTLLYGKIRRSKKWTGVGLMACYCSFLFATIIQILAFGTDPAYWASNAGLAIICGGLWLRWRFKTAYVNPKHFTRDVVNMR